MFMRCFFFKCAAVLRDLHSFPTRRSSDLAGPPLARPDGHIDYGAYTRSVTEPLEWIIAAAAHRAGPAARVRRVHGADRKSTRLNSSHMSISYAVFCLKKKKKHTKCAH